MGMFISGYSMTLLVFGSIEVFKIISHCSVEQFNRQCQSPLQNKKFVKPKKIRTLVYLHTDKIAMGF